MADRRPLVAASGSLSELPTADRLYHPGSVLFRGAGVSGADSLSIDSAGRVGIHGAHSGTGAGMLRFLEVSIPSALASMGGGVRLLNNAASDLQVYLAQDNSGYVKLGDATKELGIYAGVVALYASSTAVLTVDTSYVTIAKPLKFPDGTTQSTASTGGAGATVKEVTLDFGTDPVFAKSFTFSDASALTTHKIMICASGATDSSRATDELEMDLFLPAASCKADGTITVVVQAHPGPVTGPYKFNYTLG